ncbi:hypothetical protein BGZ97_002037 [Linnemannia gamsii]|jgi:TrmH family RNA methyltransferase|uniref:tRNA/rRNA methyltransferase SpoU type domain-containing protein n=1 Tax=Linnemannia gamsii TaxID=64522 RepID=A0A9P6QWT7_9FUNG|nr:hypothetical protein BGZ97_002037 [Linnemannia gamsii]
MNSKSLSRIVLPSRFQVITSSQNQVVQRLERLRRSKEAREEEGHVVVQGIKTLQELGSKGHHRVRTIGVTYDKENGPIRSPALDVVAAVQQQEGGGSREQSSRGLLKDQGVGLRVGGEAFRADQYVAVSRKLTTRILGTDSPTAVHEVWAEVAIPDHNALFSATTNVDRGSKKSESSTIEKLLVFDQVSDPGNMGLMIRSAKAFSWSAGWQTPGTVDPFNDKVVRASRALCLDFPMKVGGRWKELEVFLKSREMVPLIADMVPNWISQQEGGDESFSTSLTPAAVDPYRLVWWNWPSSLSRNKAPEKIALIMSSEHHGVEGRGSVGEGSDQKKREKDEDRAAKRRLLDRAIRVSIPMNPAVESMNVAAAATAMMWELNRVLDSQTKSASSTNQDFKLQIFNKHS